MNHRVRNYLVVAAVVLVFGVAAADALRDAVPGRTPTEPRTTTGGDDDAAAELAPVPGARGSLVFTDPKDCRVREVAAGSATEYPLEPTGGNCRLWVPPFGARVAYGVANASGDGAAFQFLDLNHPEEQFATEYTFDGRITWALDGQRATWCESPREAVDFEFYAERLLLGVCSAGYTTAGEIVVVRGSTVLVSRDGRPLVGASAPVDEVSVGVDGSVGILAGGRLERYAGGRRTHGRALPDVRLAGPPDFSPDNCGALVPAPGEVRLVDLGCLGRGDELWPAKDAAWSPDGAWIAFAVSEGIVFTNAAREALDVVWPQNAAELGWRGHVPATGG